MQRQVRCLFSRQAGEFLHRTLQPLSFCIDESAHCLRSHILRPASERRVTQECIKTVEKSKVPVGSQCGQTLGKCGLVLGIELLLKPVSR